MFPNISQCTKKFKESKFLSLGASSYPIIIDFIKRLGDPADILVYFNPESIYFDEGLQFAYFFPILREEYGWAKCDVLTDRTIGIETDEEACLMEFKGKYIVIIDTATTKDCLKAISKRIRGVYPANAPHICFISLCKSYTRLETESLVANEIERIRQETEKQERVKEKLISAVSSWRILDGGLPYFYFYNYYPEGCNVEADDNIWAVRRFIWDFKDTSETINTPDHMVAIDIAHHIVRRQLETTFSHEDLKELTLVCIPASSHNRNISRYEEFTRRLCGDLNMINALPFITVLKEREPRHIGSMVFSLNDYHIDEDFFRNKNVLLFDDIVTRGDSMRAFKWKLEQLGANVIAGMSLGQTKHERSKEDDVLVSMDLAVYFL